MGARQAVGVGMTRELDEHMKLNLESAMIADSTEPGMKQNAELLLFQLAVLVGDLVDAVS